MHQRGGRRAPSPPPALQGELVRRRLLDVVGRRFQVPLTVIVAGAGFGKSTLLAQAIRANHADPRGIDAWLSCEPADCDADHLAAALVAALGQVADRGEPIERVLDAVDRLAPIDVCLVVDDVHELPPRSTAAELLGELIARLPPHGHLVLAGRTVPPTDLSGRRLAGQVVDMGIDELAFTATEVDALARSLGRDGPRRRRARTICRLAVARAPGHLGTGWLGAAVLVGGDRCRTCRVRNGNSCSPSPRSGGGRRATWRGSPDPVTAGPIRSSTPDSNRSPPRCRWSTATPTVGIAFTTSGRTPLSGSSPRPIAATPGDEPSSCSSGVARRCAPAGVRCAGVTSRPWPWPAGDWSTRPPAPCRSTRRRAGCRGRPKRPVRHPTCVSCEVALLHARDYDDTRLDDDLDAVIDEYSARGDNGGTVVALVLAMAIAHMRGDVARLLTVDEVAKSLPHADDVPALRFLRGAMRATKASLEGDAEAAVAAIEAISAGGGPSPINELVLRLHANMLCLCGRAEEAVEIAAPTLDSPSPYVRTLHPKVRWLAGDPGGFPGGQFDVDVPPGTNDRYHLYHAYYGMAIVTSFGRSDLVDGLSATVEKAATIDVRDDTMLAFCPSPAARCRARRSDGGAGDRRACRRPPGVRPGRRRPAPAAAGGALRVRRTSARTLAGRRPGAFAGSAARRRRRSSRLPRRNSRPDPSAAPGRLRVDDVAVGVVRRAGGSGRRCRVRRRAHPRRGPRRAVADDAA